MSDPIRLGVIGLGTMGKHHARVASALDGIELVGGLDPSGDRFHALAGRTVFGSLESMLRFGVDAAVVAVPSGGHEQIAVALADAGVHALIEKPLSDSLESAVRIRNAFADTGLVAAVGHVERCNPAVQAMKRRLDDGELGEVIAIALRRVGPHPDRVRDVGVVRDLATHDIDLALWIGGRFKSLSAEVLYHLGNQREDLVEAVGRLEGGAVASISVNWLTPTKVRSVSVLGERGAFVADLLSADLTLFANANVPMEWEEMARLRGVSEGDMIRYALPKPEPLRLQLEHFRDAVNGTGDLQIVTLDEGVEVLGIAERIIESGRV